MSEPTIYESHEWNPGEDDDWCVACGVTYSDCLDECPAALRRRMLKRFRQQSNGLHKLGAILAVNGDVPQASGYYAAAARIRETIREFK